MADIARNISENTVKVDERNNTKKQQKSGQAAVFLHLGIRLDDRARYEKQLHVIAGIVQHRDRKDDVDEAGFTRIKELARIGRHCVRGNEVDERYQKRRGYTGRKSPLHLARRIEIFVA